jgi:GGDEF domain-containing protein
MTKDDGPFMPKDRSLYEALVSMPRSNDAAGRALLVDTLTGFGTRQALIAELEEAVQPESRAQLLVVFGLEGFDEYVGLFGSLAGRTLLVKLSARLQEALAPRGRCYRPRYDEFAALIETSIDAARPLLDGAVGALRERATSVAVTAAWGAALLPAEAGEPIRALRIADERLASNAPRRRPRNRRSSPRN